MPYQLCDMNVISGLQIENTVKILPLHSTTVTLFTSKCAGENSNCSAMR